MLLLFFLAWVIFNGRLTLEIALFGIAVSGLVFGFICKFMDHSLEKERNLYRKMPLLCKYVILLVKEIVKANLAVCKMILTRREVLEPVLVKIHTGLKTETARVMLANSITLTPGTITMDVADEDDGTNLYIHWIDVTAPSGKEAGDAIKANLEKGVRRVFK